MTAAPADPPLAPRLASTALAVACLSAGLLAWEIELMRRLLIERWHHFGYLVISVALLGFGASGTLLAPLAGRIRRRPQRWLFALSAALFVALLVLPRVAAELPVAARFIPQDLWRQVGWWSLYWLAALIPFLLGGAYIGAALLTAGPHVGPIYAANLVGSAIGAAGAALLSSRLVPIHAHWPWLAAILVAVLCGPLPPAARYKHWPRLAIVAALTLAAVATETSWPLAPVYDEHKYAARLQLLAKQDAVRRIAARADPHGYVELYASNLFHDLPFLALSSPPPPMFSLVVNGDPAGSVLRIDDASGAAVMDRTLMALPYRLLPERPRALLAGETGGTNVWLARRQNAARIDATQPNTAIFDLLRAHAPAVLADDHVHWHTHHTRAFLATAPPGQIDLIQIAAVEGLGFGATGLHGLAEDHLLTVEGLAAGLRALSDDGVLAVCRGLQYPGRENIRLLATLSAALESAGIRDAGPHLIQVRDYLGICTLALKQPLDNTRRQKLRDTITELGLTPIWYDGVPAADLNRPDVLEDPPGHPHDWLHEAAVEILSPRRQAFFNRWLLNVRPPHDDSPFFWDFYKPGAIAALKQTYGDLWLTRAELGRLFLYVSLVLTSAAAVVLILLPLGVVELLRRRSTARQQRANQGRGNAPRMVLYFAGIGLGFMGIEMALISRAIRWLGEPVLASALVIGGLLVLSGGGSLISRRIVRQRIWLAPTMAATGAIALWLLGWGLTGGVWWLLAAVPTACCLGMSLPSGIHQLNEHAPRLVPWAWGVNGVASVCGTSAAIALAMIGGYHIVMLAAAAAYALAAVAAISRAPAPAVCLP